MTGSKGFPMKSWAATIARIEWYAVNTAMKQEILLIVERNRDERRKSEPATV